MKQDKEPNKKWLSALGLRDFPFNSGPVALQEPDLAKIFVNTTLLERLKKQNSSLVFGESGQGKTAHRVALMEKLRQAPDIFPITYSPVHVYLANTGSNSENWHSRQILRTASIELLQRLILNPAKLNSRNLATEVKTLLADALRFDEREISYLSDSSFVDYIFKLGAPWLTEPAITKSGVKTIQNALQGAEKRKNKNISINSLSKLLKKLGIKSAYLLLDEFDGVMETAANPASQLDLLLQVNKIFGNQTEIPFHIKAFLPYEVRSLIAENSLTELIDITWERDSIISILSSRLAHQSKGRVRDFQQLCNVESSFTTADIVSAAKQLIGFFSPRETLFLANLVFHEHLTNNGPDGKLTSRDLINAVEKYRAEYTSRPPQKRKVKNR